MTDCADSVIALLPLPRPTYQIPQRSPNLQFLLLNICGLTVNFPSIYSLCYIGPQLFLNFLTLDIFHPCCCFQPTRRLIKENAWMRGVLLWGDVQLGRWDASAKGWSGMCGILVGISLQPPCTIEYCPILSFFERHSAALQDPAPAPPFTCMCT